MLILIIINKPIDINFYNKKNKHILKLNIPCVMRDASWQLGLYLMSTSVI